MATIKDVAKAAGVGVGTASRALSGNSSVSLATKKKVEETAKSLGFVPNQLARNFKKQSTGCVAIIVPTVFHPFFAKMVLYCESELYKVGYRLIVVSSQDDKNKEARMLEMIRQQRVDGIIFITHYDHGNIDPDLPIVSVDRHVGAGFPYVTSDNYAMSRRAVELLREKGARNIGCVCGATVVESETKYRYTAYLDAMRDCGAEPHLLLMQFRHGQEMDVLRKFFSLYPDTYGLFTGSDMLASAAYHVAVMHGVRVPDRLQIVGYDGILDAWDSYPKLTTVRQDIPKMAQSVVELLLARITGKSVPARVEIPAELVLGETTK